MLRKPVCGSKVPLGLSCPAGTAVLSGSLLARKRERIRRQCILQKPYKPAPHEYPLHKKQLIFVKKQNSQTRGTCRGKAPPSCSRKNVLPLESPTGAFIAAQPRSGCFAIIKNNFSAEYAQSEAEGILNHQSVSPAKFPPLPAGWTLRPHCPGR